MQKNLKGQKENYLWVQQCIIVQPTLLAGIPSVTYHSYSIGICVCIRISFVHLTTLPGGIPGVLFIIHNLFVFVFVFNFVFLSCMHLTTLLAGIPGVLFIIHNPIIAEHSGLPDACLDAFPLIMSYLDESEAFLSDVPQRRGGGGG